MKRFIYILTLLLLACTSCVGELGMDDGHKKDGIVLTIYNAPLTKAVDNTGEAYERELKTLDIFFYPKGQTAEPCVFYHHEDLSETFGQTEVSIYVVEDAIRKIFPTENLCDIFVIANLPAGVKPADAVYEAGSDATRLPVLESYVLDNTEANYDSINKPFVMAGLGTAQKDSKKNAEGTISLVRASSKVTLTVVIPDYIDIEKTMNDVTSSVRMVPTFEDAPDVNTMNVAFHNGVYKGYLFKEVDESMDDFHKSSTKQKFTYTKTLPAVKYKNPELSAQDSIPQRRVYTCNIPFYTYAHKWEKGAADASYVTFEMKWGADIGDGSTPIYETYYYQILINGAGRTFQPNHWYDMYVNVGVIGSTIEIKPIVLDHLEFFVLDWSDHISGVDHPKEDVELKDYMYFNVLTKRLELDNVTTGVIEYKASHDIAWALDDTSSKTVEGVRGLTTTLGAYYIDCSKASPEASEVTGFYLNDNGNGEFRYTYSIPENIYSPIYINLILWLEFDGEEGMGPTESAYSEHVTIVQYPAIYITPDQSTVKSIFVDGRYEHDANITYGNYRLGAANGTLNNGGEVSYMYVINVSQFDNGDKFTYNGDQVSYIIGDPRVRDNVIDQESGSYYDMRNNWVKDQIQQTRNQNANNYFNTGIGRSLQYYYPTSKVTGMHRVIAPKFRISSFFGGYSSNCNSEGAAMRCASYQEDGYPAGRWRVPTTAEVAFIVSLQQKGVIQEIFYKNNQNVYNDYFSSTDMVNGAGNITIGHSGQHSVRCVYDDWYWGSEREARTNTNYNGDYEFTWGDEKITW